MPSGITLKAGNIALIGVILVAIVLILGGKSIVETVDKGTYHIKQAAITGDMTAHMSPGMYGQYFGDIQVWPVSETFFFTADKDDKDDSEEDLSIEVRFNDGSLCKISGTLRVQMPSGETQAIDLVIKKGFRTYRDVQSKLILPTLRNALRLTANLMSARESYSEKRADYIFWANDQIINGLYETSEDTRRVKDLISGAEITKTFKIIKVEENGEPTRQQYPLEGTGITLANFEIKTFVYEPKVQEQIATQQQALMAIATATAQAQQAEQEALTEEAQGKKKVMTARYAEEEKKIQATVQAQKEKEVAVIAGEREKEVAALQRDAAKLQKEREILLGEGESKRKAMVLQADGALDKKLQAYIAVNQVWADAFKVRRVPQLIMGGGSGAGNTDAQTSGFAQMMQLLVARQMGLKLDIPEGATTSTANTPKK